MQYHINHPNRNINGVISLDGSKSISNRVLCIQALCDEDFKIDRLSTSDDTQVLQAALASEEKTIDVGHAGTSYRFSTAYFAAQEGGEQILTGSERMKQRPIGPLVDALRQIGADIEYMEKEGYPPLLIKGRQLVGNMVRIPANISSQYISALMLIAPTLPNGLEIHLEGDIVSRSYWQMTLDIQAYFGIQSEVKENIISIPAQTYQAKDFVVEADWSAASYYYAIAAFADELDLQLNGLFLNSLQGDSAMIELGKYFGIHTDFNQKGIKLSKKGELAQDLVYDFILCPDIAQTIATMCTGLQIPARMTGLSTLKIKETDRIQALQNELAKFGADFIEEDEEWFLKPPIKVNPQAVSIPTYKDHRMAMAFAPLAILEEDGIIIEEPMVVNKSYHGFWGDLESLGFVIL